VKEIVSIVVGVSPERGPDYQKFKNDPWIGGLCEYEVGGEKHYGYCTGYRDKLKLPVVPFSGAVYLPPYVEIDGELQLSPNRVLFLEEE